MRRNNLGSPDCDRWRGKMAVAWKLGKPYYKVRVSLGVMYPSEKPQRRKQRFIGEALGEYIGSLAFGRNVHDGA